MPGRKPPPLNSIYEDKGIIAAIPGEFIAQASRGLPDPFTTTETEGSVEIEAGHVGWVRIHYRLQKHRHGKYTHCFWTGYKAERLTHEEINERQARAWLNAVRRD